jgi:beta-phosphoglucomutase-like phosphatase (HAD superfamily)
MSASTLQALIFDVDGTLADTESAHRAAFNQAFAEVGRDWFWDEALYTRLLEISGGKERMLHYWRELQPDLKDINSAGVQDTVERMHAIKTAAYERAVQDGAVQLRPGVLRLIESANQEGLRLAIATTTSPVNIGALLRSAIGPDWRYYFMVPATGCLAFEDSANGLKAATGAGLATLVTPNSFTAHHDFTAALRVLPSLQGVTVAQLRVWHAEAPTALSL